MECQGDAVNGDPKMHIWHPFRSFMTLNYTNPDSSPIQNKTQWAWADLHLSFSGGDYAQTNVAAWILALDTWPRYLSIQYIWIWRTFTAAFSYFSHFTASDKIYAPGGTSYIPVKPPWNKIWFILVTASCLCKSQEWSRSSGVAVASQCTVWLLRLQSQKWSCRSGVAGDLTDTNVLHLLI